MGKNKLRKKKKPQTPINKPASVGELKQGKTNLYILGVTVVVAVGLLFYGLGL